MVLERLSGFSLIDFLVLALAAYRLSTMLANDWESGPKGILDWIRKKAGLVHDKFGDPVKPHGSFIDGMMCEYCNSIWIGTIFTLLYASLLAAGLPASLLFLPLAISGVATILYEFIDTSTKGSS